MVSNQVARQFNNREYLEVVVSDLTYVRVAGRWNYVCLITDLHNREFIGHSAGPNKDPMLAYQAFAGIRPGLKIRIFHTDRGNEFKNSAMNGLLETFGVQRSLRHKDCLYDNLVVETAFKIFKWYNHIRIHSSLGYRIPVE